jgi:hypothetical protein
MSDDDAIAAEWRQHRARVEAGKEVVRAIAERLNSTARGSDLSNVSAQTMLSIDLDRDAEVLPEFPSPSLALVIWKLERAEEYACRDADTQSFRCLVSAIADLRRMNGGSEP